MEPPGVCSGIEDTVLREGEQQMKGAGRRNVKFWQPSNDDRDYTDVALMGLSDINESNVKHVRRRTQASCAARGVIIIDQSREDNRLIGRLRQIRREDA